MAITTVLVSALSYLKCYSVSFHIYTAHTCTTTLVKNVVEINGFLEVIIIFTVIIFYLLIFER